MADFKKLVILRVDNPYNVVGASLAELKALGTYLTAIADPAIDSHLIDIGQFKLNIEVRRVCAKCAKSMFNTEHNRCYHCEPIQPFEMDNA